MYVCVCVILALSREFIIHHDRRLERKRKREREKGEKMRIRKERTRQDAGEAKRARARAYVTYFRSIYLYRGQSCPLFDVCTTDGHA